MKYFNDFSTRDFCSQIEKSSDAKFEGGIIIVGVWKEEIEICRDTGSYELLGWKIVVLVGFFSSKSYKFI